MRPASVSIVANAIRQGQRGAPMPWSVVAPAGGGIRFAPRTEPGPVRHAALVAALAYGAALAIWRRETLGPARERTWWSVPSWARAVSRADRRPRSWSSTIRRRTHRARHRTRCVLALAFRNGALDLCAARERPGDRIWSSGLRRRCAPPFRRHCRLRRHRNPGEMTAVPRMVPRLSLRFEPWRILDALRL